MPRLTRKLTAVLLTCALGVLAATLWPGLRFRDAPPDSPQPGVCEEWKRAEAATQNLGWDLTYLPLLRSSGVCPGAPSCEVMSEKPQPPVNEHFVEWRGDPIVSSILVELPDGHADMAATWLVRTKEHAYWWGFHPHRVNSRGKQPIPVENYDHAFEAMACWRQGEPAGRTFGSEGYIGFLSLYKEGKSRQLLLTHVDLFEGSKNPDEAQPGRFWRALRPLMSSIAEQQKQATPDHQ